VTSPARKEFASSAMSIAASPDTDCQPDLDPSPARDGAPVDLGHRLLHDPAYLPRRPGNHRARRLGRSRFFSTISTAAATFGRECRPAAQNGKKGTDGRGFRSASTKYDFLQPGQVQGCHFGRHGVGPFAVQPTAAAGSGSTEQMILPEAPSGRDSLISASRNALSLLSSAPSASACLPSLRSSTRKCQTELRRASQLVCKGGRRRTSSYLVLLEKVTRHEPHCRGNPGSCAGPVGGGSRRMHARAHSRPRRSSSTRLCARSTTTPSRSTPRLSARRSCRRTARKPFRRSTPSPASGPRSSLELARKEPQRTVRRGGPDLDRDQRCPAEALFCPA